MGNWFGLRNVTKSMLSVSPSPTFRVDAQMIDFPWTESPLRIVHVRLICGGAHCLLRLTNLRGLQTGSQEGCWNRRIWPEGRQSRQITDMVRIQEVCEGVRRMVSE